MIDLTTIDQTTEDQDLKELRINKLNRSTVKEGGKYSC